MVYRVETESDNIKLPVVGECEGEIHSARIMNDRQHVAKAPLGSDWRWF
jgi:hypothetical protein